jgi:hypothetical protein
MALVKAQIIIEKDPSNPIPVLFNPEEYTLNKDNNFAAQAIPGLSGPILQFVNGNMRTLEMELFFDTWDSPTVEKQDVRTYTDRVAGLMEIDSELHAPPVLIFSWSSLRFRCVLARASQKFIMFADTGKPVRARVTVTFNEYLDPDRESKEVNRLTADFSKAYVVSEGETLSGIAGRLYGDPQKWRPIAICNRIADPRVLSAGQTLQVPSLPFTDPETGVLLT